MLSWPIPYHRMHASTRIIISRWLKIKRHFQPKTDNFFEAYIYIYKEKKGVCVCVKIENWAPAVRPRRIGKENDMIPNVSGAGYCNVFHGCFNESLA